MSELLFKVVELMFWTKLKCLLVGVQRDFLFFVSVPDKLY